MSSVALQLEVLLEQEREEKRLEELAKEQQKAALLRFRIGAAAAVLAIAAIAVYIYNKRETLRLAGELERAQREGAASFDNLSSCVASHKLARSEADGCKAERDRDQAEFSAAVDAMSKKGADGDKLREMQTLLSSYAAKLRTCNEDAKDAQKQCSDDRARLVAATEREKTELGAARDEQKALVEARDKELATARAERDVCIDQKAQILIQCAGVGSKPSGGSTGSGSTSGGSTGGATTAAPTTTAPAPTATEVGTAPASTGASPATTGAPPPPQPTAP